jgi:hypothetical protein
MIITIIKVIEFRRNKLYNRAELIIFPRINHLAPEKFTMALCDFIFIMERAYNTYPLFHFNPFFPLFFFFFILFIMSYSSAGEESLNQSTQSKYVIDCIKSFFFTYCFCLGRKNTEEAFFKSF